MRRASPLMVVAVLASAAGPVADEVPRIIDDTPEFCHSLAGRLATLPAARQEPSRSLGEQGVKLCDEGQFRLGIAKLRRALRAAQDAGAPSSEAGITDGERGVTR